MTSQNGGNKKSRLQISFANQQEHNQLFDYGGGSLPGASNLDGTQAGGTQPGLETEPLDDVLGEPPNPVEIFLTQYIDSFSSISFEGVLDAPTEEDYFFDASNNLCVAMKCIDEGWLPFHRLDMVDEQVVYIGEVGPGCDPVVEALELARDIERELLLKLHQVNCVLAELEL